MIQDTQKLVEEITNVEAALANFVPKIRTLLGHLRAHAATAETVDANLVARKERVLTVLRDIKRHTEATLRNAIILRQSLVFPSANILVNLLSGQNKHLQTLITCVQSYDTTQIHKIETELTELAKLYEATLLFLRKKEEGKKAAA